MTKQNPNVCATWGTRLAVFITLVTCCWPDLLLRAALSISFSSGSWKVRRTDRLSAVSDPLMPTDTQAILTNEWSSHRWSVTPLRVALGAMACLTHTHAVNHTRIPTVICHLVSAGAVILHLHAPLPEMRSRWMRGLSDRLLMSWRGLARAGPGLSGSQQGAPCRPLTKDSVESIFLLALAR